MLQEPYCNVLVGVFLCWNAQSSQTPTGGVSEIILGVIAELLVERIFPLPMCGYIIFIRKNALNQLLAG